MEHAGPGVEARRRPFRLAELGSRSTWRSAVAWSIGLALSAVGAFVTFTTARMMTRRVLRIPFYDQWQEVLPERSLATPFAQHNEHRIFFGRLVFALDSWLAHGRGTFSASATFVFLAASAVLVAIAATRGPNGRSVFAAALGSGAALLLAAYSWENLLCPFQASFVDVCPAAVLAFVALGTSTDPDKPRSGVASLGLAGAGAVVATYSIASGVAVPLLLVLQAVLSRRPARHVAALVILALVLVGTYLHGYEAPHHHADPTESLRNPGAVLRYAEAYLGAPLSQFDPGRLDRAQRIGAVGLVAWAALALTRLVRFRRNEPVAFALPFVATFAVGWAFVTALGRANFPVEQAFSSRYGTPSLLFWCALVGEGFRAARSLASLTLVGAVALTVAALLAAEQDDHEQIAARVWNFKESETALLSMALEKEPIDRITPAGYLVKDAVPELRRRHLSIFGDDWARWIGEPLDRFVPERDDRACKGSLDVARPVPAYGGPAFHVEGWAYLRYEKRRASRVAIVDSDGIVRGLALGGYPRTDVHRKIHGIRDRKTGFVGQVGRLGGDTTTIAALAISGDGRVACELGHPIDLDEPSARALVIP